MGELWDSLTGQKQPDEYSRGRAKRPRREPRSPAPSRSTASASSAQTKPPDVSERVWAHTEYWLDKATEVFGKRPPINRAEFSRRFAERIRSDKAFWANIDRRGKLRDKEKRLRYINDQISLMTDKFFDHLDLGDENTAALQFKFLDDEWAHWRYEAEVSLDVRALNRGLADGTVRTLPANTGGADPEKSSKRAVRRSLAQFRREYLRENPPDQPADLPDPPTPAERAQRRAALVDWLTTRQRKR